MLAGGGALLDQLAVDDFVMALGLGDREEIFERGGVFRELLHEGALSGSI
jgi:hypothetical protein